MQIPRALMVHDTKDVLMLSCGACRCQWGGADDQGHQLVRLRDGLHHGGRPVAGTQRNHPELPGDRVAHQAPGLQHRAPALLLPGEPLPEQAASSSLVSLTHVEHQGNDNHWECHTKSLVVCRNGAECRRHGPLQNEHLQAPHAADVSPLTAAGALQHGSEVLHSSLLRHKHECNRAERGPPGRYHAGQNRPPAPGERPSRSMPPCCAHPRHHCQLMPIHLIVAPHHQPMPSQSLVSLECLQKVLHVGDNISAGFLRTCDKS